MRLARLAALLMRDRTGWLEPDPPTWAWPARLSEPYRPGDEWKFLG